MYKRVAENIWHFCKNFTTDRLQLSRSREVEVLCGSEIRSGLANICICRLRVVALNGNNAEVFGHNYQSIKVVSPLFQVSKIHTPLSARFLRLTNLGSNDSGMVN